MATWNAAAPLCGAAARRGIARGKDARRLATAAALALAIDALALASLAGAAKVAGSDDEAHWITVQLESGQERVPEGTELPKTDPAEKPTAQAAAAIEEVRRAYRGAIDAAPEVGAGTGTELDAADAAELDGAATPGVLVGTELGAGTELGKTVPSGVRTGTELAAAPAATREDILARLDDAIDRKLWYPKRARERGIEGRVLLEIGVDEGGALQSCAVEASSGSPMLDGAARRLVADIFPLHARLVEPFTALVAIEYRLR